MKKSQKEFYEEILRLKSENPKADIILCVDNDEIAEGAWTAHEVHKIELNDIFIHNDETYIGRERIRDEIADILCDHTMPNDEFEILVDEYYNKNVKQGIFAYTTAYCGF